METFLTAGKPSYETVLDLDQKIRKYMLSAPFDSFLPPENDGHALFAFIQRTFVPRYAKLCKDLGYRSIVNDADPGLGSIDVHT